MIVNSHNIEFGYELISVLPHAYSLHLQGKLSGTISGNDTDCLYYFSKKHEINKEKRSWYNTKNVSTPNINIHRHTLDKKDWTPPPLKEQYKNERFKFEKELVIICNRHNIEWEKKPINFFDIPTLESIFELLKDYQVIYINVDGRPELYDNAEPISLNEWDTVNKYKNVINIHDLANDNKDLSFNELQLMLFANCSKFITMNGGHAILAAYFGGENIVMSKYGETQAKELHKSVNSFYRWYNEFSGQRVMHVKDEQSLLSKIKSVYVDKEPEINILVRTSGRKKYFESCFESIQKQGYENLNVWISIDNPEQDKYMISYPAYQIEIEPHEISDVKEKNKEDGIVFPYNHYINVLHRHIKSGYVMYLDDDDFLHDGALKEISEKIKDNDLVFWQVKIGQRVIPDNDLIGKEPKLFNISGIGYCFNSSYINKAFWRPFKRADYHCAKSLYEAINKKTWIKKILAETQNGSHSGLRIDKKIINKNKKMVRNKVLVKILKNKHNGMTLKYKVGDVVELTESKAKQFVLHGIAKAYKGKK